MSHTRTLLFLGLAALLASPAISQDDSPEWVPPEADCTGQLAGKGRCHHGSQCVVGPADYGDLLTPFADVIPFLAETDVDGEHCECGSSHTGVNCEHRYEICSEKHSGFACFHDSECVKIHDDSEHSKYSCDCSKAKWAGTSAKFAGLHCEYGGPKDDSMEYCEALDADSLEEAEWFCVNDGRCTGHTNINKKCKCKDGWTGPHCEFKATNEDAPKAEDCTLKCHNGGQCKHGIKDYGAHAGDVNDPLGVFELLNFDMHENGQHCVCPGGYTGLTCDVEVNDCKGSDGEKFFCYNGSTCKKTTMSDGTKKHYCDCEDAFDAKENKGYAGEFCQYKSTQWCDPVEGKKESLAFCVNFGICPVKKHDECFCPPGFAGHQCETRGAQPPTCNLNCKNGGKCRTGIADFGHSETFDLPFQKKGHIDFEHCSCPEGFTGVDCSIKLEICGDKKHVCAHGSTCIAHSDGSYACDCTGVKDNNGKSVAGKYCENSASDMCVRGDSGGAHSFCVNGGSCVGIISSSDPHPGCLCKNGFEGVHCEVRTSAISSEPPTTKKTKRAAVMFTFMILIIGVVLFAAILATRKFATGKEMDTGAQNSDVFDAEGPVPNTESSEDGELTDVEII